MSAKKLSDLLEKIDTKKLANFLSQEHVQTIAAIVSYLESDKQVEVIQLLPKEIQSEVTTRIAQLGVVDSSLLDTLCQVIEDTLIHKKL